MSEAFARIEGKSTSSSLNVSGARANIAEREAELERCRRSLKFFPCYSDNDGENLKKACSTFLREGMLFSDAQIDDLTTERILRRGKMGSKVCTLEVMFERKEDRDYIFRCSSNLARSNASVLAGDDKFRINAVYPNHLKGLKTDLLAECIEIRKLGVYKCQLRYTDCDRDLTIFVRAIDDSSRSAFWQERDELILFHGKGGKLPEGLPEISKLQPEKEHEIYSSMAFKCALEKLNAL